MGAQAWNDSLIKRLQVIFTLACENSRLSSLLAAWDVSPEETSAPLRQKFHTDDVNQCSHNESGSHGVPNANLFDFMLLQQGSKFKFQFGSTCATRYKFLGALLKF